MSQRAVTETDLHELGEHLKPVITQWAEKAGVEVNEASASWQIVRRVPEQFDLPVIESLFDAIVAFEKEHAERRHREFKPLFRFCHATFGVALAAVTPEMVRCYFAGPGVTLTTARKHAELLILFFDWCVETGRLPHSPADGLYRNRWAGFHPVFTQGDLPERIMQPEAPEQAVQNADSTDPQQTSEPEKVVSFLWYKENRQSERGRE